MHWKYWLDYLIFPPAIVAATFHSADSALWLLTAGLGFCLWTFIEYWVHRTLLHGFLWYGTHERHHRHPDEFVEAFVLYTPALFIVLWFLFPTSIWVGFAAGYVWFITMHHWLHHSPLRSGTWIYGYAKWHGRHHKLTKCNYGITTSVWDRVFSTST